MWLADKWKDYEVIDASAGEKLERWGRYILLRPDPQVIWSTTKTAPEWRRLNARYHRSKQGGGSWEFFSLPEQWSVGYDLNIGAESMHLAFHLKPFSFKHTGIFPEQAVNWQWFASLIARETEKGRQIKVLNLFAYTGGATAAAALAGAHVTHVDSSKGMTAWAKENMVSSGVKKESTRWITDDCRKFAERELRRGNRYDAIIMDPPSFGRGPKGEIWKIEDNVYELIELCAQLLSRDALFFLINSYTTGLQPAVLAYMLGAAVKTERGGSVSADEIGLPVRESGLVLPCGASGRWVRD